MPTPQIASDGKPYRLTPVVGSTVLTGCCFTIFKFLAISQIALGFHSADIAHLPYQWLRTIVENANNAGTIKEAFSQGMAAVLTIGILLGYVINAPLAGAWRVGPLFVLASLGMVLFCLARTLGLDPWLSGLTIGIAYGTACAARGKSVPLLAEGTGRHNTFVSGLINSSLVVGLLIGTIVGNVLAVLFVGKTEPIEALAGAAQGAPSATAAGLSAFSTTTASISAASSTSGDTLLRLPAQLISAPWLAYAILVGLLLVTVAFSTRIRVPEQPAVPFLSGLRSILGVTAIMLRRHWALLISGGIAWGIASAASLAVLMYGILDLGIPQGIAGGIAICPAIGAIVGNLISDRLARRRWVSLSFILLAVLVAAFPYIVSTCVSVVIGRALGPHEHAFVLAPVSTLAVIGAIMAVVGMLFATPTNVVDARFLAIAGKEGYAGYGGTVFSLIHNVFILLIGSGLAVLFFGGLITARTQFIYLGAFAILAMIIALFARLQDDESLH